MQHTYTKKYLAKLNPLKTMKISRVSGFTQPTSTELPLEVVKTKLYRWIVIHTAANSKPNLATFEMRGK